MNYFALNNINCIDVSDIAKIMPVRFIERFSSPKHMIAEYGDIIELKAVNYSGKKQLKNILKQHEADTLVYRRDGFDHAIFKADAKLLALPFDQLCITGVRGSAGLFVNMRNGYSILPPSAGSKWVSGSRIANFPADLCDYLITTYNESVFSGRNFY